MTSPEDPGSSQQPRGTEMPADPRSDPAATVDALEEKIGLTSEETRDDDSLPEPDEDAQAMPGTGVADVEDGTGAPGGEPA